MIIYNTGGLVLPYGADVTFGSGEAEEEYRMEESELGDIVPGVLEAVPAARTQYKALGIGESLNVNINGQDLKATHWGSGVVLLDRDRARIWER